MSRDLLSPAGRVALNALIVAAAIALVAWVAARLRIVVVPVIVALLAATLLVPPVDWLRRHRWPSALATLLVMLVSAAGLVGLFAAIGPTLVDQFGALARTVEEGVEVVLRWLSQGPLGLERSELERSIDRALAGLGDNARQIAQGVLSGATLVAELLGALLLGIVLIFFFVHDGRGIWDWVVSMAPDRHRELVDGSGHEAWKTLTAYVRGVAVIALVDAVLIGIALAVIGVPLVLPLAVLVFLGAFIPLVGAVLAGAVAALVALIDGGLLAAVLVVAAITIIQQLEGNLLYPVIVGRAVRLHAIAILLALALGTVVAGVLGAFLSVPLAAAVWTSVEHVRETRRRRIAHGELTLDQPAVPAG